MSLWDLVHLKRKLGERHEVLGWVVTQESIQRRERYFLDESGQIAVDQDREARQLAYQVRVIVRLEGRVGRHGESLAKLLPHLPIEPQLDKAIASARLTDFQTWSLPPAPGESLPELRSFDPRVAEDINSAMERLSDRMAAAVSRVRDAQFNSSELFVALHEREQHFSNGLIHRSKQTRVYAEAAFSAAGRGVSDEYLEARWSVTGDGLPLEQIIEESAHRARMMLEVGKMGAEVLPVLVDSEVLLTLLNGHLSQLSGSNRYHDLPCSKVGDALIPSAQGDLLTLHLDPGFPEGADTIAISGDGTPQRRRTLVENNRVLALVMDQQHGQYLGEAATVSRGTLVLEPGTRDREQLLRSAPRVLEVLQFSGLFADENSGTFGSEIRLARLHDWEKGTIQYIKGGSLSGSIHENFRDLGLSSEVTHRCHFENGVASGTGYFGPAWALLSGVSVGG
jgi:predicted Zn-dependent protease